MELDQLLSKMGYEVKDPLRVMRLNPVKEKRDRENNDSIVLFHHPSSLWLSGYASLNTFSEFNSDLFARIAEIVPGKTVFGLLMEEGRPSAVGMGVLEGEVMGIQHVIVRGDMRRKGLGRSLTCQLMDWGKQNGATEAILQVLENNIAARNLYHSIGFEDLYPYWYREKTEGKIDGVSKNRPS